MEQFLGSPESRNDIAETDLTHHHQIDITAASLFESGHRTIDEGHIDPTGQECQGLAQDIGSTSGLDYQAFQLRENWAFRVGLVINLVPSDCAPENPYLCQPLDLPLDCSQTEPA